MNLAGNLTATAAEHPGSPAVKLDDVVLSYAALEGAARHAAGLVTSLGAGPGDRVALMLPNVPYFPILYYGALAAGAVVVPMNPLLKAREVRHHLQDAGVTVLFAWHGFAEAAEAGAEATGARCVLVEPGEAEARMGAATPLPGVVDRDADDTAVLLYTSGTTGRPKGAELTHANLMGNVATSRALFGLGPDDVVLGALPLFHSFGQTCGMNAAVHAGACLSLIPRFDPGKALAMFGRDGVTVFEGVPTMYGALLDHPDRESADSSRLRTCVSGGASLPVELLRAFEAAFGCPILEGYGLSETSPVASFNQPGQVRKPGSIGTPIAGVEMKVVGDEGQDLPQGEVGEIAIRGPNVMKGYWNDPDATAEVLRDGWLHTGDMARVDEDGAFFIVDRKKDLIIRGGLNVYPREVEEVLFEHPAVREAAVVAVPDASLGEEVGAAVALKDGASATEEELRAHVRDAVAAYKYPRHVWFVDELPKGPTGKVLKREIRAPGT